MEMQMQMQMQVEMQMIPGRASARAALLAARYPRRTNATGRGPVLGAACGATRCGVEGGGAWAMRKGVGCALWEGRGLCGGVRAVRGLGVA